MPKFEVIARRQDVEEREYPVGYRFHPTRDGVVWVVENVERDGDSVRHLCRVESAASDDTAAPPRDPS
jgi:hypothetical protein